MRGNVSARREKIKLFCGPAASAAGVFPAKNLTRVIGRPAAAHCRFAHFRPMNMHMRVLLVDDDARMRVVLGKLLESAGFPTVAGVGDGQEALDRLAAETFDLVVTDCNMPRLNGIAFVTALRA